METKCTYILYTVQQFVGKWQKSGHTFGFSCCNSVATSKNNSFIQKITYSSSFSLRSFEQYLGNVYTNVSYSRGMIQGQRRHNLGVLATPVSKEHYRAFNSSILRVDNQNSNKIQMLQFLALCENS